MIDLRLLSFRFLNNFKAREFVFGDLSLAVFKTLSHLKDNLKCYQVYSKCNLYCFLESASEFRGCSTCTALSRA
jgi:hypothetical protein